MIPSTDTFPAPLDFFCTDEETFAALREIMNGCPLPENVIDYIDPYQWEPTNLPGEVWYYVKHNVNADSSFGHWKAKGGDCKLYSNSPFTGWRTTYEYCGGQAPHDCKATWIMQKYWMSQTVCENSKQKETSSLCKVFLGDEQFQNREKIQKIEFSVAPKSESIYLNVQLAVPDGSNNVANGSTSKSEMSEDDKMVELAVAGKPLVPRLAEIPPEMDYSAEGDFLELLDLDIPTSPSSSENSSCLTMSSDEDFDTMDVLCDVEHGINHDRAQRDAACIHSSAPSRLKKEVVHPVASESLVSIRRSHPLSSENLKTNSTVLSPSRRGPDLKLPGQRENEGYRLKGEASSSSHNNMVSNGKETAVDGGKKKKKKTVGRMKKMQKKYLCFFSF